MNQSPFAIVATLSVAALLVQPAAGQDRTPPASAAEKEQVYTLSLEKRSADILADLALADTAKAAKVHDAVIAQYRALRARDEVLDTKLKAGAKEAAGTAKDPTVEAQNQTKTLHDQFLAKLSAELTPEQVEKVKDKMTYGKVKFTYEAYCNIVPGLTDAEKAKILEVLKQAREEAIDGGSAPAKSAIFQKYKDQINSYLAAQGHDVQKALKDWNAKQEKAKQEAAARPAQAAQ